MASQRIATLAATNVGISTIVTSGTVLLVGALTTWDNHRGRDHQVITVEINLGKKFDIRVGVVEKKLEVVDRAVDEAKEEIKHTFSDPYSLHAPFPDISI